MVFKILSKIIYYSNISPTNIPLDKNIYLYPLTIPYVVKSKRYLSNDYVASTTLSAIDNEEFLDSLTLVSIISTLDLLDRGFLMATNENR